MELRLYGTMELEGNKRLSSEPRTSVKLYAKKVASISLSSDIVVRVGRQYTTPQWR